MIELLATEKARGDALIKERGTLALRESVHLVSSKILQVKICCDIRMLDWSYEAYTSCKGLVIWPYISLVGSEVGTKGRRYCGGSTLGRAGSQENKEEGEEGKKGGRNRQSSC